MGAGVAGGGACVVGAGVAGVAGGGACVAGVGAGVVAGVAAGTAAAVGTVGPVGTAGVTMDGVAGAAWGFDSVVGAGGSDGAGLAAGAAVVPKGGKPKELLNRSRASTKALNITRSRNSTPKYQASGSLPVSPISERTPAMYASYSGCVFASSNAFLTCSSSSFSRRSCQKFIRSSVITSPGHIGGPMPCKALARFASAAGEVTAGSDMLATGFGAGGAASAGAEAGAASTGAVDAAAGIKGVDSDGWCGTLFPSAPLLKNIVCGVGMITGVAAAGIDGAPTADAKGGSRHSTDEPGVSCPVLGRRSIEKKASIPAAVTGLNLISPVSGLEVSGFGSAAKGAAGSRLGGPVAAGGAAVGATTGDVAGASAGSRLGGPAAASATAGDVAGASAGSRLGGPATVGATAGDVAGASGSAASRPGGPAAAGATTGDAAGASGPAGAELPPSSIAISHSRGCASWDQGWISTYICISRRYTLCDVMHIYKYISCIYPFERKTFGFCLN